jgi:hypothetical protein
LLGRYQFKEALTSFLLHHAAPETAYPAAPASDRPNHAHLRRPRNGIGAAAPEVKTFST